MILTGAANYLACGIDPHESLEHRVTVYITNRSTGAPRFLGWIDGASTVRSKEQPPPSLRGGVLASQNGQGLGGGDLFEVGQEKERHGGDDADQPFNVKPTIIQNIDHAYACLYA